LSAVRDVGRARIETGEFDVDGRQSAEFGDPFGLTFCQVIDDDLGNKRADARLELLGVQGERLWRGESPIDVLGNIDSVGNAKQRCRAARRRRQSRRSFQQRGSFVVDHDLIRIAAQARIA